ncbi:MAG: hypothetical protein KDA88_14225 [Planctomycetaceae bacterium]|nr:hypothetical protein [Planctomycetaceae bacterium]MCB9953462.1 hypothetical protein [Planctomycetaceae bacterium]
MSQNQQHDGRSMNWLLVASWVSFGLAAACFITTIVMMKMSFDNVANSETTPNPADLANGIRLALIPSVAAVSLGIAGAVFLVLGLIRRRTESFD